MKQLANVVLENGKPMAEIIRPEACMTCNACKFGQQQRMLVALPKGNFEVGQQVELELPDGRVGKASLLAYGIPLVGLLLGLWAGYALFGTELAQMLCALVLTGAGVLALKLIEPRLRKSGQYEPSACPHHQGD